MTTHVSQVWSAQTTLLSAKCISVEVDISKNTLQQFTIVGLPDKAVAESRDRVSAALKNSGFTSPKQRNEKVVVSLAPASLKKEGPLFDLAIAVGYLKAGDEIDFDPSRSLFLGELSLSGDLCPLHGILALVREARERGFTDIFVPKDNAAEAALVSGMTIFGAETLAEVVAHLLGADDTDNEEWKRIVPTPETRIVHVKPSGSVSLEDIKGQETAKRALAIAAAGGHNLALYGPPGTGKTMLAKALRTILPPLSFDEIMEVTAIHSIAGLLSEPLLTAPPFRSPHHTASYVSLVGGGTIPRPGEVTLAHRGVLFCDEFLEFDRRVIEALREPLEEGVINISRASGAATFPANFILIAAMNPCPCGNFGSHKECTCMPLALSRYQERLSGPIMDRVDLWVEVSHIPHENLREKSSSGETVRTSRAVRRARSMQRKRSASLSRAPHTNAELSARELIETIVLDDAAERALDRAARALDVSPRSYHRLIKVARTIADLAAADLVREPHIMEALQYRPKI